MLLFINIIIYTYSFGNLNLEVGTNLIIIENEKSA